MNQQQATARARRVDMELVPTIEDRALGTIEEILESLPLKQLQNSAATILALSGRSEDRAIEAYGETELRGLLGECVATVYQEKPELLSLIENFLDAIARARLVANATSRQSKKLRE